MHDLAMIDAASHRQYQLICTRTAATGELKKRIKINMHVMNTAFVQVVRLCRGQIVFYYVVISHFVHTSHYIGSCVQKL